MDITEIIINISLALPSARFCSLHLTCVSAPLVHLTTLWSRCCPYPHLIDQETEASVTCPKVMAELSFELFLLASGEGPLPA